MIRKNSSAARGSRRRGSQHRPTAVYIFVVPSASCAVRRVPLSVITGVHISSRSGTAARSESEGFGVSFLLKTFVQSPKRRFPASPVKSFRIRKAIECAAHLLLFAQLATVSGYGSTLCRNRGHSSRNMYHRSWSELVGTECGYRPGRRSIQRSECGTKARRRGGGRKENVGGIPKGKQTSRQVDLPYMSSAVAAILILTQPTKGLQQLRYE